MTTDEEFLESLREDFVTESLDLLEGSETELLEMERDHNPSHLEEVRRSLHSLKGSAKAVGYIDYSAMVHTLESVIAQNVPSKKSDQAFVSDILICLDGFKELTKAQAQRDIQGIADQIQRLQEIFFKIQS